MHKNKIKQTRAFSKSGKDDRGCLSCGTTQNMRGRKYCSIDCRQKLRHQLNIRTGLLKALNTRYATFYFTELLLVLDVLPLDSKRIYSFLFGRSRDRKPVDDFSALCNILGNAWWNEMNRTNRGYLASRHVLNRAVIENGATESLEPEVLKIPAIKGGEKALLYLKIEKETLQSGELTQVIKSAYRRQARHTHPDMGGDGASFRKIYQAYQVLMAWAEEPSFLKRSGFPDRWFYDGSKNRWVQPTPHPKMP